MENFKKIVKTLYTYFFNWFYILKFNQFGTGSFLGRRFTLHKCKGGVIKIGNNVRIANDSRISLYLSSCEIPKVIIHDNVYCGSNISIITASKVEIFENVLMASYITILGENHSQDPENPLPYGKQGLIAKPVTIREGVWIGEKVAIMPGVTIGEKSVIGTSSVVTKDIPAYSIAVGNPAKVIKQYNFFSHTWNKI